MGTLYIAPSILGFETHLKIADALAIVQQQLETTKNMGVVQKHLNFIRSTLLENFDTEDKVLQRLSKWKKQKIDTNYLLFKVALADDFMAVTDEEYLLYGDIYQFLEDRYLDENTFANSNSSNSGYD